MNEKYGCNPIRESYFKLESRKEKRKKNLIGILLKFIEFCDKHPECGLVQSEFQGKEVKIINEFLEND
jgi:hypothetical protein